MNRQTQSSVVPHHARLRAAVAPPLACVLAFVVAWGLAGCGQKGPLTLPKAPPAAAAPASGNSR